MGHPHVSTRASVSRHAVAFVGLIVLSAVAALPVGAASAPKSGAACKRSQVGLAAPNGLVCTKVVKVYRWRARPVAATPATPAVPISPLGPTTTVASVAALTPVAGGAIGKKIWFSDQEIELVSLTMVDRNVVLETRITNSGLRDDRTLSVLNNMPVVVDTPTGSVRLAAPLLPSVAIGSAAPGIFRAFAPGGFALAGATVRFGDSGANAVSVPIPGEPVGSQKALSDFVAGSAAVAFGAGRTSQTDVRVTRSLLRPQIRPGTKNLYDLQLELTITVGIATSGGANVEPGMFTLDGTAATCCTDLTSLIYVLGPGQTITGWMNFTLRGKPGPTATLSVKGGSAPIPLTLNLTGL